MSDKIVYGSMWFVLFMVLLDRIAHSDKLTYSLVPLALIAIILLYGQFGLQFLEWLHERKQTKYDKK